jgi:hypothetical protein
MTRFKLALLFSFVTIVGVLVWSCWAPKPEVHGDLSQHDVSAIVQAVKSDMWSEVFPDHSWKTMKRAPRGLFCLLTARVSEVTLLFGHVAKARGSYRFKTQGEGWITLGWDSWSLERKGTDWVVKTRSRKPAADEPVRPLESSLTQGTFSEALSNNVRISFDLHP